MKPNRVLQGNPHTYKTKGVLVFTDVTADFGSCWRLDLVGGRLPKVVDISGYLQCLNLDLPNPTYQQRHIFQRQSYSLGLQHPERVDLSPWQYANIRQDTHSPWRFVRCCEGQDPRRRSHLINNASSFSANDGRTLSD